MAFKLKVSDTVLVPVKGEMKDEAGRSAAFSFSLVCKRLMADELRELLERRDATVAESLVPLTQGWRDVLDEDGKPVEFSSDALAALLNFPGVAGLAFQAYLTEVGARGKEKN